MANLKVKLTEMKNADVRYISLVDRAASRIPFRVIKYDKESGMGINLKTIGRVLKGTSNQKESVSKAEVSAVVVLDHGELTSEIQDVIEKQGFSVQKAIKNEDGTVTFAAGENPLKDAVLVKLSDEMLLAVKGMNAYMTEGEFEDMVKSRGFMPSISTAMEVLYTTISNAMYNSDVKGPEDFSKIVTEATGKFSEYVIGLVSALPEAVFKMDAAVNELVEKKSKEASKEKAKGKMKEAPAEGSSEEEAAETSEEETKEKSKEMKATQEEATGEVTESAEHEKEEEDQLKKILTAVSDLAEKVSELSKKSEETSQAISEQGKRLEEVASSSEQKIAELSQKAENASKAVKSTILAAAPAGDTPTPQGEVGESEGVKKYDYRDDPRQGCFDTAFIRRKK